MSQAFRFPGISLLCGLILWVSALDIAWARSEYEVKAAYLYNFIKFISWPAVTPSDTLSDNPIDICIYGEDPFNGMLQPMEKLQAQGRPLRVRYPSRQEEIDGCDVLFISASENKFLDELVARANQQHMLTVSDIKDFTRSGGMIGFVTAGNVIRFQINLSAARATGIEISTKLLELAQEVTQ